jgi:hypothetical protein
VISPLLANFYLHYVLDEWFEKDIAPRLQGRGHSIRHGRWVVQQTTARRRLTRPLHRISDWCRNDRHLDLADQHRHLTRQLQGHGAYFGLRGNYRALEKLRNGAARIWRRWLDRRSQRARMDWGRFRRVLARYPLPPPRLHPVVAPA